MHDIAILGGGPAGCAAALELLRLGRKPVLIEQHELGGVCLNRGCIPTKTLRHAAHLRLLLNKCGKYGINAGLAPGPAGVVTVDYAAALARVKEVINLNQKGLRQGLKGATIIQGTAELKDKHTITVGDDMIHAEKIIIATGSRPTLPSVWESLRSRPGIYDPETVFSMTSVPPRMAIIGAGASGCELAFIFAAFGTEVHLFETAPAILPEFDAELSAIVKRQMTRLSIQVHERCAIDKIQPTANGVTINFGDEMLAVPVGVFATGRRSVIHYQRNNNFLVNGFDNVFLIGDAAAGPMTAARALWEGKQVAALVAGTITEIPSGYLAINGVYTFPEIAGFGAMAGDGYTVEKKLMRQVAKSHCDDEMEGMLKIVRDRAGAIAGGWLCAAHATELIHTIAVATHGKKVMPLHPTQSELFDDLLK